MIIASIQHKSTNLILSNFSISYSLRAPKNQSFFGVFREYQMETLVRNEMIVNNKDMKTGLDSFKAKYHLSIDIIG